MGKKVTLFGCDQCTLTYNYRCNLKRHVKKCHVPNGHPCPYCPCTYEKVAERDSHIKTHNKIISERGQASTTSLSISDELNINCEVSTKAHVKKSNQNGLTFQCLDKKCSRTFPSEWGRSIHYQRSHLKLRKIKNSNNHQVIPKKNIANPKIRKKQTKSTTKSLPITFGSVTTTNHFIEALQKTNENSTATNIVKLVFLPKNRKSLKQQFNSLISIGTGDNLVYQVPEPISDVDDDDKESNSSHNNNMLEGTENMDDDEDFTTQEINDIPNDNNNNDDDEEDDEDQAPPNIEKENDSPIEYENNMNHLKSKVKKKKKKYTKRKEKSTKTKKPIVEKPLRRRYRKAVHLCPICNQLFTCKTALRVHIAEHPGEKPWHCDECWFSFRHQPEIYQHRRWHHVPNGKYRCTFCSCSFDKETVFKRHMNLEKLRQGGIVESIVKQPKVSKSKTEKKKDKLKKVNIPKEPTEQKKRGRKRKIVNFDQEQLNDNPVGTTTTLGSLKKSKIMPKVDLQPGGEVFQARRTGRIRIPKTKH